MFARVSVEGPKYEPALIRLAPWHSTPVWRLPTPGSMQLRLGAARRAELQWLFAVVAAAGDAALSDLHQ